MKVYHPLKTSRLSQGFGDNKACARVHSRGVPYRPFQIKGKVGGVCSPYYEEFYRLIGLKGHNGLDHALWTGEPIYFPVDAPCGWTARLHEDSDGGLGVDVFSDRPLLNGRYAKFRFWHLDGYNVNNGQPVRFGQVIGFGGMTGAASGPHLHWSMKFVTESGATLERDNGYTGAVDFSPWYDKTLALDVLGLKADYLNMQQILSKATYDLSVLLAQLKK